MKDFFLSLFLLLFATFIIVFVGMSGIGFDKAKQLSAVSSSHLTVGDFKNESNYFKIPNFSSSDIEYIKAKGFLSVYFGEDGETVIAERNADNEFLIASITKLVSIISFLNNFTGDIDNPILISSGASKVRGPYTGVDEGESFKIIDLIKSSLIASSNQSVFALAEIFENENEFVKIMNKETSKMGLQNTFFYNSTGLDDISGGNEFNFSTPKDLVQLAKIIMQDYPLVKNTSTVKEFELFTASGDLKQKLDNTNQILFDSLLSYKVLMSKTGQTPTSGQNLLIVTSGFKPGDFIVSVFLNSTDRFADATAFLNSIYNNL